MWFDPLSECYVCTDYAVLCKKQTPRSANTVSDMADSDDSRSAMWRSTASEWSSKGESEGTPHAARLTCNYVHNYDGAAGYEGEGEGEETGWRWAGYKGEAAMTWTW
jgi:hypothetical protein